MAVTWKTIPIMRENGQMVEAQAPQIVSASRSTDIPAFYCDWFFHRLKKGYSAWTNPFNGKTNYVSYENTRFIVFWSKNPRPLLKYLDLLEERGIGCYIQYSVNDYENEDLEKAVPTLNERIETFKLLVERLGKERVIWRFDPLILMEGIDIEKLLIKIANIGDQLYGYTEKLVFSYADISTYRKVKVNMEQNCFHYYEWNETLMCDFAKQLSQMNKDRGWNYTLATCGEKVDLKEFSIEHNHCVDDELIIRLAYHDKVLMDFLGVKTNIIPTPNLFGNIESLPKDVVFLDNGTYAIRGDNKDKGQRKFCGCIKSKDIGEYNTCVHMCEYCYANTNKNIATQNHIRHKNNSWAETITGK